MLFEEMMKDEFKAGKAEGKIEGKIEDILEVLADLGSVSDSLKERIRLVQDDQVLNEVFRLARKSGSIGEFQERLDAMLGTDR
ncbi:MAG: hypothetical protein Q4D32_10965 [Eubacteriales bacterium]|nr:hypothetical protein [Eubacteriales bacterium]